MSVGQVGGVRFAPRRSYLVLLVSIAIAIATATPAHAATPGDSVRGNGELPFGEDTVETFTISARSGPDGSNPGGSVLVKIPPNEFIQSGTYRADVTCLNADGNTAYIGFIIRSGPDASVIGSESVSLFTDDSPDTITSFGGAAASQCSDPGSLVDPFPQSLTKGDFRVTDR